MEGVSFKTPRNVCNQAENSPLEEEDSCSSFVTCRSSKAYSCSICLSSLLDAASLSCGHKFCERCLDTYWQTREKPPFIVCPLCRFNAYNIIFTEKKNVDRNDTEFRSVFERLSDSDKIESHSTLLMCIKLTFLVVPIYYLFVWLTNYINPKFVIEEDLMISQ